MAVRRKLAAVTVTVRIKEGCVVYVDGAARLAGDLVELSRDEADLLVQQGHAALVDASA